jgi:hypothetical protein
MKWQDEPESGDSAEEERTGYGRWEEDGEPATSGPDGGGGGGAANPDAPGEAAEDESHGTCELCGGPTLERHCKILCLTCGYQRDCSDP